MADTGRRLNDPEPRMPTLTAFERSPDRGRGLARDMRVRWAFEEVGQPYDVRLVSFPEMKAPAHRARHPFGQIPTYEDGGLVLFESGAIVLHIAPDSKSTRPPSSYVGIWPNGWRARCAGAFISGYDTSRTSYG